MEAGKVHFTLISSVISYGICEIQFEVRDIGNRYSVEQQCDMGFVRFTFKYEIWILCRGECFTSGPNQLSGVNIHTHTVFDFHTLKLNQSILPQL